MKLQKTRLKQKEKKEKEKDYYLLHLVCENYVMSCGSQNSKEELCKSFSELLWLYFKQQNANLAATKTAAKAHLITRVPFVLLFFWGWGVGVLHWPQQVVNPNLFVGY